MMWQSLLGAGKFRKRKVETHCNLKKKKVTVWTLSSGSLLSRTILLGLVYV